MATARLIDVDFVRDHGIREFVQELRESPERLDKEMRKQFREEAKLVRDKARSRAAGMHPTRTTPKKQPTYHWSQLVNSIVSGAQTDSPFVSYGRGDSRNRKELPGWAGWEFGSSRFRQFPARTARVGRGSAGRFFFPVVREETPGITERVAEIVNETLKRAFPD